MKLLHLLRFSTHWPPHRVFLLDGVGASVSLAMTAVILWLQPWFGMPAAILKILLPLTGIFVGYSLLCWLLTPRHWRLLLGLVAVANLAYAVLLVTLLVLQRDVLTALGVAYFAGEALILLGVGMLEIRLLRKPSPPPPCEITSHQREAP